MATRARAEEEGPRRPPAQGALVGQQWLYLCLGGAEQAAGVGRGEAAAMALLGAGPAAAARAASQACRRPCDVRAPAEKVLRRPRAAQPC